MQKLDVQDLMMDQQDPIFQDEISKKIAEKSN